MRQANGGKTPEIGCIADVSATGRRKSEQRLTRGKKLLVTVAVIVASAACFALLVIGSGYPAAASTPPSVECPIPEFPTALIPVMGMLFVTVVFIAAKRRNG